MNEIDLATMVDYLYRAIPADRVEDVDTVTWYVPPDLTDGELEVVRSEMVRRYPHAASAEALRREGLPARAAGWSVGIRYGNGR